MKKILFSILLLPSFFLSAQDTSFIYGDMQAMGGYPMFGLGFRAQTGKHALDISGNLMPLNIIDNPHLPVESLIFHAKSQYLFYPSQNGFYLGTGLGLLTEPESLDGVTGSLEGVIGYQWNSSKKTRLFFELNGIMPFQKPGGGIARVWPGLSFGIGF